jgi:hypothetical protein
MQLQESGPSTFFFAGFSTFLTSLLGKDKEMARANLLATVDTMVIRGKFRRRTHVILLKLVLTAYIL